MSFCLFTHCKNTCTRTPEKVFIEVPYNRALRSLWFKAARQNIDAYSLITTLYICEDHFDLPNDMANYQQWLETGCKKIISKMKPDVLPHKNLDHSGYVPRYEDTSLVSSLKFTGKFCWEEIAGVAIPFIIRSTGEMLAEIHMLKKDLFKKQLEVLSEEVFKIACPSFLNSPPRKHKVSTLERKLLNEINAVHCDYYFSKYALATCTFLLAKEEVIQLYNVLDVFYKAVTNKTVEEPTCGYILINESQTPVPFVDVEGKGIVVPLFFFECPEVVRIQFALTDHWAQVYIKLFCKLLSILETFYNRNNLMVVRLEDLKNIIPEVSQFTFIEELPSNANISELVRPEWSVKNCQNVISSELPPFRGVDKSVPNNDADNEIIELSESDEGEPEETITIEVEVDGISSTTITKEPVPTKSDDSAKWHRLREKMVEQKLTHRGRERPRKEECLYVKRPKIAPKTYSDVLRTPAPNQPSISPVLAHKNILPKIAPKTNNSDVLGTRHNSPAPNQPSILNSAVVHKNTTLTKIAPKTNSDVLGTPRNRLAPNRPRIINSEVAHKNMLSKIALKTNSDVLETRRNSPAPNQPSRTSVRAHILSKVAPKTNCGVVGIPRNIPAPHQPSMTSLRAHILSTIAPKTNSDVLGTPRNSPAPHQLSISSVRVYDNTILSKIAPKTNSSVPGTPRNSPAPNQPTMNSALAHKNIILPEENNTFVAPPPCVLNSAPQTVAPPAGYVLQAPSHTSAPLPNSYIMDPRTGLVQAPSQTSALLPSSYIMDPQTGLATAVNSIGFMLPPGLMTQPAAGFLPVSGLAPLTAQQGVAEQQPPVNVQISNSVIILKQQGQTIGTSIGTSIGTQTSTTTTTAVNTTANVSQQPPTQAVAVLPHSGSFRVEPRGSVTKHGALRLSKRLNKTATSSTLIRWHEESPPEGADKLLLRNSQEILYRVHEIPEHVSPACPLSYKMKKVKLKGVPHLFVCISYLPFDDGIMLINISDVCTHLFPNVDKKAFMATASEMKLDIFALNSCQKAIIAKYYEPSKEEFLYFLFNKFREACGLMNRFFEMCA